MANLEELRELVEEIHKMSPLADQLEEADLRKYLYRQEKEKRSSGRLELAQDDQMQCCYGL